MTNGALAYATKPAPADFFPYFQRVLFTTDFSETSLRALPLAGAIARTFGSELKLIYALTPGDQVSALPEFTTAVANIFEGDAKARLATLQNSLQLEGLAVKTEVYKRGLDSLSLKVAADEIDLVVMASHGKKGIRHLLLGSVAEEVIHTAAPPVLTAGPHVTVTTETEFRPKHVLFATDATADSFRALPYAVAFTKRGCSLTLVHVLAEQQQCSPQAEAFAALLKDALHRTLPLTTIKTCNPEIIVRFGNPVKEILNVAGDIGCDLIAMGARSNTNRATFSRSVSYGVVANARCPVLTVRGQQK